MTLDSDAPRTCRCGCGKPVSMGRNWRRRHSPWPGNADLLAVNPSRLCHCGCGGTVEPGSLHRRGHSRRVGPDLSAQGPNPSGGCLCGCGQPTALAKFTSSRDGNVRGQPKRFVLGHGSRLKRGHLHSSWKGGRVVNRQGYALLRTPEGHPSPGMYVMEHRLVMEEALGRYLQPYENVHHRNGIRDDNRLENLELWVKPQAVGQRVEDLVAWVVSAYPGLVAECLGSRMVSVPK